MRTGIYGGTFNPIHMGHLHLLEGFIRRLPLDRVLLIPTGTPPHKQAHALASAKQRLDMCRLAVAGITEAPVELCEIELRRPGKSYTADTLEGLRALYPADDFFLLMGEDMFMTVDSWYRPETIMALAALCCTPRSQDGLGDLNKKKKQLERDFSARCFVEAIPYFPASSTQVRELAARGESLEGLEPPAVADYIKENGLYRPDWKEKNHGELERAHADPHAPYRRGGPI